VKKDLNVARKTAARYLDSLCEIDLLHKKKLGKENYYFNDDLISLLINVGSLKRDRENAAIIKTTHR
jgi:hypothetical protein